MSDNMRLEKHETICPECKHRWVNRIRLVDLSYDQLKSRLEEAEKVLDYIANSPTRDVKDWAARQYFDKHKGGAE